MGFPQPFEADKAEIVAGWTSARIWCIGTPDDLVAAIHRLDEQQRRLRRPDDPAGRLGDARAVCTATSCSRAT